MPAELLGAIEAGGTKFVCAVGTGRTDIWRRIRVPTTTPKETMAALVDFFGDGPSSESIAGIGIASFGPLELRPEHPEYGRVVATPKPGWEGADLVGPLVGALGAPVEVQTDVIGAALAEWRWGAGRGLRNIVYMTVGTGIGAGCLLDGVPVEGLVHAEMGHVTVRRHPDDRFDGRCPFHGDCLEGMASGPALEDRWGKPAEELVAASSELLDRVVDFEAHYLASGLRNVLYTVAPQRIVIGGGVSGLPGLVDLVGDRLVEEMAGYGVQPEHREGFVVPPGLGADAGLAGGFALAEQAATRPTPTLM